MRYFAIIAEERIQAAMERGEFDRLQGAGKPLPKDDLSMIPEELRMAYRILRNSGHAPPELEERKRLQDAKQLLAECSDEQERLRHMQRVTALTLALNERRKAPANLEESEYYEDVMKRVK